MPDPHDPPDVAEANDDSSARAAVAFPAATTGPTGRERLLRALSGRPNRSQAIVGVLLALLGYAATVQIQLTHSNDSFTGQRRENLVELLDSLSGASDRVQDQITTLQGTRAQLESGSGARAAAIAEAQQRLRDIEVLAGTVGAQGPGVTVTIDDPEGGVTAASLLNGIEELRDAGAEAIQINGRIRFVQSSWIAGQPGAIVIDGHQVQAPYVVEAIGSAHTLSDAVGFPGGLADEISALGGRVAVEEDDSITITALHPAEPPQYSHPTGQ